MKSLLTITIMVIFSFCNQKINANNVQISNVNYIFQPAIGATIANHGQISFKLSWDNSWKSTNHNNSDGVYVFFYYNNGVDNIWRRVYASSLYSYNTNCPPFCPPFIHPSGVEVSALNGGVIIKRSDVGVGNIASGLYTVYSNPLGNDISIKGFAVEMVSIPTSCLGFDNPFYGDFSEGQESTNAFHFPTGTMPTYDYIYVTPNPFDDSDIENGLRLASASSTPYPYCGPIGMYGVTPTNVNFPLSNRVKWVMKYEICQSGYRDFLNCLTLAQQTTRTANAPTSAIGTGALTVSGTNRNFIEIKTPSIGGEPAEYGCDASNNNIYDEGNDGEGVACNFLSWMDIAAWLDWAGMQPMTELDYERMIIGPAPNAFGIYAWGNRTIHNAALTLANPFIETENISNTSLTKGNANYASSAINGPLRSGIFSTVISDTRKKSGGAYYGVMDLSGNLSEACVTIGNIAGRSYNLTNNSYGDGTLASNGNALVNHWPGNVAVTTSETLLNAEVTTAVGTIRRGGSWNSPNTELRKADRSQGEVPNTRTATQGGRGVINLEP